MRTQARSPQAHVPQIARNHTQLTAAKGGNPAFGGSGPPARKWRSGHHPRAPRFAYVDPMVSGKRVGETWSAKELLVSKGVDPAADPHRSML
jgi:hypothetical protein